MQQVGFRRFKRGYKPIPASIDPAIAIAAAAKEHKDPTDPYFAYQWYLVSRTQVDHTYGKARRKLETLSWTWASYKDEFEIQALSPRWLARDANKERKELSKIKKKRID